VLNIHAPNHALHPTWLPRWPSHDLLLTERAGQVSWAVRRIRLRPKTVTLDTNLADDRERLDRAVDVEFDVCISS
jgi:hypothetical protein